MILQQNRVRPITLFFEIVFYKYFTEMITVLGWRVRQNIWVATLKVKITACPCSKSYLAHNCVICSRILKLIHRNDHHIGMTCHATFWSLPWRSRSKPDLAAISCPAHNFAIWSPILKLFHRNDHHIRTPCRKQHLGRYLESQGHSKNVSAP